MTSRFVYQPEKMIVFFSKMKNKYVILLSTMRDSGTVIPVTGKLEVIEFYNMTIGGVDCIEKMCHSYTIKKYSCRWPIRYFYGMLVHNRNKHLCFEQHSWKQLW